eukprot:6289985-Ditylum_brightwellii.AAC.1
MVEHHMKSWLYLFTKPDFVEDKDEFELSKKSLFSYLKSPIIAKAFGHNERIIRTVENTFLKRKTEQHFDVSSNNAHKGTNYGMKLHAAA